MDEPKGETCGRGAEAMPRWGRTTDRRWVRWNKAMKARFLDHLAATCNVAAAAGTIGVEASSIYALRRRDPAFAAAWGAALLAGYEMLETQLVGHALSGGGATAITNGDPGRTGPIDVELAVRLLGTHRAAMQGKPFTGGTRPRPATREETNAAILKKLRMVEARNARALGTNTDVDAGEGASEASPAPGVARDAR